MSLYRCTLIVCMFIVSLLLFPVLHAQDLSAGKADHSVKEKDKKTQQQTKQDSIPETTELPETVVKGQQPEEGPEYTVESSTMGLKTETPLRETPHTVNIVTKDLLKEQGASAVDDVWRNVPGAHTAFGEGGGGSMVMRGFSVTGGASGGFGYPLYFNGLRGQPYGGYNSPRLYNLERMEILKGPSAVLYGSGGPGGMINMVSRKPERAFSHELDFTCGSYDLYRGHVHSTGPMTNDGDFLYLIDLGFEDSGSFRDHVESRNAQITAGFSWLVAEDTRLDFEFGHVDDRRDGQPDRGIPCVGGKFFVLPDSFNPQEPTDFTEVTAYYGEIHLSHAFSNSLSLNMGFRAFESEQVYHMHFPRGLAGSTLTRTYMEGESDITGLSGDTNLLWEFDSSEAHHKLLVGFDLYTERSESQHRSAVAGVPPIDIFNPVYGADTSTYTFSDPTMTNGQPLRYGAYIQKQIELRERLHLMAGVRYDVYNEEMSYQPATTAPYEDDGGHMTFKGGVLYEIDNNLSVYGSYGESYQPQNAPRTPQPRTFDPLQGWQVETGIKGGWFDDRLNALLAGFYIVRENVLVSDPLDPMLLVMIGQEESKGIEFEITGQVTADWSVSANYTFTEGEVTEHSDPAKEGVPLGNSAKHQAGLWTRYDFWDTGFAAFGGINYVGKRRPFEGFVDRYGVDNYPAYTRIDAGLSYRYEDFTVRTNVNNIFDEEIALGGRGGYGYMPGEPRTLSVSLEYRF